MSFIKKTAFYISRHPQTTDNVAGLISGGLSNPKITEQGLAQANEKKKLFNCIHPIPTIISTGRIRTDECAKIISGKEPSIINGDLVERKFGPSDGKTTQEEWVKKKGLAGGECLPGEEPIEEHRARVVTGLNKSLSEVGENAFFITHAGTIRRILEATEVTVNNRDIKNCAVLKFKPFRNHWRVFELSLENEVITEKMLGCSSRPPSLPNHTKG